MNACGAARARSPFSAAVLEVAIDEIGNGEAGRNNAGPDVARYFDEPGRESAIGPWCAAFVSYCMEEAARRLGIECPIKRSHGAKQLFRNSTAITGIDLEPHETPRPGDLILWQRGVPWSWQGHIGIVEAFEEGIAFTIEGNTGRYPARVRRLSHDTQNDSRLLGYAGIS